MYKRQIWGSICGKKYMIEVPEHVAQQADIDESKLPKFGTIVGIIPVSYTHLRNSPHRHNRNRLCCRCGTTFPPAG